jgi:hypothetical protein
MVYFTFRAWRRIRGSKGEGGMGVSSGRLRTCWSVERRALRGTPSRERSRVEIREKSWS